FKLIRERLKKFGLSDLKDISLPENAIEIRFWVGFSHEDFRGLFIKKDGLNSSAILVPNILHDTLPSVSIRHLDPPAHGWQSLMDKLQQLGLFDLLGETGDIPEKKLVVDVTSAVVEIKTSHSYKTFRYRGVFYFQDEDIIKLEKILETLSSEFA